MQNKAMQLQRQRVAPTQQENKVEIAASDDVSMYIDKPVENRPIYSAMIKKLTMLQPIHLTVEDESYKHSGHGEMAGKSSNEETHFSVTIVSKSFQNLTLVQRHRMVYTLLAQEMKQGIHALSISAKTPTEI